MQVLTEQVKNKTLTFFAWIAKTPEKKQKEIKTKTHKKAFFSPYLIL